MGKPSRIKKFLDYTTLPQPKASKGPLMNQDKPFVHGQDNMKSKSHQPTQWSFEEERRGWKNLKEFNTFLNEGLIQSVELKKIMKHLFKHEGFTNDDAWVISSRRGDMQGLEKLKLEYNYKNIDKVDRVHNKLINVFGWYLSAIETYDMGEPFLDLEEVKDLENQLDSLKSTMKKNKEEEDKLIFVYEPKYDLEFDKEDFEEFEGILESYIHITDFDNLDNIRKRGLVPRSKMKKSLHPDRVYFVTRLDSYNDTGLDQYIDRPIVLEVNKDLDIKLYHDPNMKDAIYTTDNISPDDIKIWVRDPKWEINNFKPIPLNDYPHKDHIPFEF
ncbi:MAG: hypothetical protein SLAVMIC_00129 [uncultured marine phage]|uniref:Uncharacterized protein n=1 Tax=uncultured marine phage TaxID=707152 RepID=A0A8D9CB24_9VIRU|nr:MAG: hypothetical protein SLAVMIC_00129 [uncultured marine phage]